MADEHTDTLYEKGSSLYRYKTVQFSNATMYILSMSQQNYNKVCNLHHKNKLRS